MRRTRKWGFVEQEAKRLIALGLSPDAIAKRLEVNQSTVRRWLKAGKLQRPGTVDRVPVAVPIANRTPEQWAAEVRTTYALDATDEQLVTMGESTLLVARDPGASGPLRLQAMGRFQAIVKQLALVARAVDAGELPLPASKAGKAEPKLRVVRRSGADPRRALMAVSE